MSGLFVIDFKYESKHRFNCYYGNRFNSADRLFVPEYSDHKSVLRRRDALDLKKAGFQTCLMIKYNILCNPVIRFF